MPRRPSKRRPARWLLAFPLILLLLGTGARLREGAVMTAVAASPDAVGYAAPGPHAVGASRTRIAGETPLDVAFGYPAAVAEEAPAIAYPYALKWFVRLDGVARVAGRAHLDAPSDASVGARPLVVLSPGFAMGTTAYAWLAERLAAHGFVVAAPEHREAMGPSMADFGRALVDRPDDVRALLDHLMTGGGPLAGAIDLERVAVVGHSLGGFTALAAAGARLDLAAFAARCAVDRAGVAEHAWLCDLVLPHAADAAAPFDWTTALAFEHAGGPRRAQVALEAAEHMVFAAGCEAVPFFGLLGEGTFCGDPAWASERAQNVIAHLTVAFLRAELMDDATAAAALAPGAVAFEDVAYAAVGY